MAETPEVFDNSKVQRELGLKFTEIDVSLRDMAKALLEFGIVQAKL